MTLTGRRALVTGAAHGIGQGIAVELARQGAEVVVHHATTAPDETLARIAEAGGRGHAVRADLGQADECERLVHEASELLGGLDILVNNAGISIEESLEAVDADVFDRMFDIDVRGTYLCARAAVPLLAREHGNGSSAIVNLAGEEADFVTGQVVFVDGAASARAGMWFDG